MTEFRYAHPFEDVCGKDLRQWLKALGVTGADLGRIIGTSTPTANDRINRPETISPEEASAIIDAVYANVRSLGEEISTGELFSAMQIKVHACDHEAKMEEADLRRRITIREEVHTIIGRMTDEELEGLHGQLVERFPDYLGDCEAV